MIIQEDTNKAIVVNTIVLYCKLAITLLCGLLTTRFALKALGVEEFGLFSVIGSVISFISIFNTIMLSTSNRFIATAIGKKNEKKINEVFNANLTIHFLIAILTLIIIIPIGDWYISNYINFDGDKSLPIKIFNITIVGSIISFIGVSYHGLMLAKERFIFFSIIDVFSAIFKLCGTILLLFFFSNKLMVYTIIVTLLTALPTILYILYCKKHFYEYSKIRMIKNKSIYKEMFNYSIWIGYGAIASIAKTQGSGLIVNRFFNTVMNASLGIANTINHAIQMIAYNLGKSMTPQITKSYACGNINRSESLVIACSKYTFLLLLLTASPFIVETEYIINLWLGEVPPNSKSFVILLIIDSLIISLNNGIPELIFASGKIKWYQIIVNTLSIFSVIVGFIVLSKGYPVHYLYYTYITFSLIILIIRQFVLNIVIKINNWRIIKDSYFPCFIISILFYVYLQINIKLNPIINIIITFVYLSILIFLIGLKKIDRKTVYTYAINLIHKH